MFGIITNSSGPKQMTVSRLVYRMMIENKHAPNDPGTIYWSTNVPVSNTEVLNILASDRGLMQSTLMSYLNNPTPEVTKFWEREQLYRKLKEV
jgi:hypothetical protein